jgi:hypothetical protein
MKRGKPILPDPLCRNGCGRPWSCDFGRGKLCSTCDAARAAGVSTPIPVPTKEPEPHWSETDR